MSVRPEDRVVIVTDNATAPIADALRAEVLAADAAVSVVLMEDHTPRPATEYPRSMADAIAATQPTVSFYCAQGLEGELVFRQPYVQHVIYQLGTRHAHMVGIDDRLMAEGMAADYREVAAITAHVTERVRNARLIEVSSDLGTDLRATLDPARRRWQPCTGLYHDQGTWGNLPEGETYTSPISVEGTMAGEVLGDHFSDAYGVLETPVLFRLVSGSVVRVDTPDDALRRDLERYLGQHANSGRVGEFAIGTNTALRGLSGNLLQDEKIPGVHIAFGYPFPVETGADWTSPTHLDVVAARSTVTVDGTCIVSEGVFTPE